MGRPSVLSGAVTVDPGDADQQQALQVAAAIRRSDRSLSLHFADGSSAPLPSILIDVLNASAVEIGDGHAVTVLASEVKLSPAETAELLGLSRPFVVRLLDEGKIPSERLPQSRHRRVLLSDVLRYGDERRGRQTSDRTLTSQSTRTNVSIDAA